MWTHQLHHHPAEGGLLWCWDATVQGVAEWWRGPELRRGKSLQEEPRPVETPEGEPLPPQTGEDDWNAQISELPLIWIQLQTWKVQAMLAKSNQ